MAQLREKSFYTEAELIQEALSVIENRFKRGEALTSPKDVHSYLKLKLAREDQEIFSCIFLDNKNRVIKYEELFTGTIDQVSGYPRIVVKRCLDLHASALIIAHCHPSGSVEPSNADVSITKRLKEALGLVMSEFWIILLLVAQIARAWPNEATFNLYRPLSQGRFFRVPVHKIRGLFSSFKFQQTWHRKGVLRCHLRNTYKVEITDFKSAKED